MRKIAFVLALSLTVLSYGCATTSQSRQGTWSAWPSQASMSDTLKSSIADMKSGDLQAADARLTPDVRSADPAASYLHAEITALRGQTAAAADLMTDFIAQNPQNPLVSAALVRLLSLSNTSSSPLNWEKVSQLKVNDPYAAARLVILQNRALRETHHPDVKHPTALPLVKWQWVGPFTPYIYTGFESEQPFDGDPILGESYELDGKRLERFQYPADSSTPMASSMSGVYAAETRIQVDREMPVQIIVQGAQLYTIFVDGNPVLSRDFSQFGKESVLASRFVLPQGEHIIRLRLGLNAATASNHHVALWIAPSDFTSKTDDLSALRELDDLSGKLPDKTEIKKLERIDLTHILGSTTEPAADETMRSWIGASMAVLTGRPQIAETLIQGALQKDPDDIIAQYWKAMRYRADADLDPSLRSENTIHILKDIAKKAPQLAAVQQLLISEFLKQQQPKQALEFWEKHKNTLPDTAEMNSLLSELSKTLEWYDISKEYALKAMQKAPNSCSLAVNAFNIQTQRNAYTSFEQLSPRIQSCPSIVRAYSKLEGNDAAEKSRWFNALDQLAKDNPNDSSIRLEAILAKSPTAPESAAREFLELLDAVSKGYYPNISTESALVLIDNLRAAGHEKEAENVLAKILELYPVAEVFRNMEWQHHQDRPLSELRIDGMNTIKEYLAQNRDDAGSSVMLLDYAATRIFPTGAKLGLTHQISRVLSKEGKNEVGEIYLPSHASVLRIRTIKDGTFEIVEPETIDFKDSVTAPNLEVGDYVEVEYLTFEPAASRYIPRVATDTFFYGSDQSPLVRSEYVFEYPKDWHVEIVESGPRNQIQRSCTPVGEFMRCTAKRENIPVFIPEPRAASPIDLIPNIQVYYHYDWDYIRQGLHESITRQTRITPYVQRFYDKLAVPEGDSVWEHARSIYDQVIESIDESETMRTNDDETATNSITRGTGSRFITLKSLYDIAGIPNYFALVHSILAPENSEQLPSMYENAYVTLLVVETEKGPAYLQPTEDYIPFDYLSADLQGQTVIPVDPAYERFISRQENPELQRATIAIQYEISEDGTAKAKSTEVMRGSRALVMRNFLNTVKNDNDKAQQVVQNSLANNYGRIELTRLEHEQLDDKNKPLTLHYDFDIASFAAASDGKLDIISRIFAYNLVNQFAQLPPSQRKYPVLIDSDMLSERTLTFHAPAGYTWDTTTLQDISLETKFGKFSRHTQLNAETLEVKESIQIRPQRIQLDQYAEFREFCLAVDEAQRTVISAKK